MQRRFREKWVGLFLFNIFNIIRVIYKIYPHNCEQFSRLLYSSAPDGVYDLQSNETSEIYEAYCHMSNLSSQCGGGGWTLVMKLNPDKVKYSAVPK